MMMNLNALRGGGQSAGGWGMEVVHLNPATAFRVRAIIAQALCKDVSEVGLDDHFENVLGGDSIKRVGILAALEAEFRVRIADIAVRRFRTARQLAVWLSANAPH